MTSSVPEEFLAVPGSPAYSSFRLVELTDSLNAILASKGSKVASVRSLYVHYVSAQGKAAVGILKNKGSVERKYLEQLLHYGDESSELNNDPETKYLTKVVNGEEYGQDKKRLVLFVSPRKGTISPWSSKATSIANVCGLQNHVKRIERGIVISLIFEGVYEQSGEVYPFADVLYDRMTQVYPQFLFWIQINSVLILHRPLNLTLQHSTPSLVPMRPSPSAALTFTLPPPPLSSPSKLLISHLALHSTPRR